MSLALQNILPRLLLPLLLFSGFSACSGIDGQNQTVDADADADPDADADADADPDADADEPTCDDGVLNGLETDLDCGGLDCEACEIGANCDDNTDCKSGLCSLDGVCLAAPTCDDGLLNNLESDLDCGGPNCPSCPDGDRCEIDTDCESGYCSTDGLCAPPTCDDGAQNGEETGVDCGGPECPTCQLGESCQVNSDCESFSCDDNTCTPPPPCDDEIQNGTETDVDCGGLTCDGCDEGQSCLVDTDCRALDCRDDNTCAPARWSTVSATASSFSVHTCATRTDGTLWCWGDNGSGQLGIGSTSTSLTPSRVGTDYNWSDVSTGAEHTCAIRTDGSIWCWGSNGSGQLGNGGSSILTPGTNEISPSRVGTSNNWNSISAGKIHTCATDNSNALWCWGANLYKQVDPSIQAAWVYSPHLVGDYGHAPLDLRGDHTCSIENNSNFYCSGRNQYGQLGNGEDVYADTFHLDDTEDWQTISAGLENTCAINAAGWLFCWGRTDNGIPEDSATNQTTPHIVSFSTWDKISVNYQHACAIQSDASLWCWGLNELGEAATSGIGSRIDSPTQYGIDTWEHVSVGDRYTCAINTDGELWCWGLNDKGQLGNGNTNNRSVPFKVTVP